MALSRRQVLGAGLVAAFPRCGFEGSPPPPMPLSRPDLTPWPEANALLASMRPPSFPDAVFPVEDSIARAIETCSAAGGGHVLVRAGKWETGALRLRSNVDLHLEKDATLVFSGDARQYPPVLTRYEGIECINRSPMVYAYGETNLALTGAGTLDASRTAEWNRGSDREGELEPLVPLDRARRVVTGRLRTAFVEPYRCRNVLIQGVRLVGAQFWQLHPTLCEDVIVDGVTTSVAGANSDACDPESCRRVVIRRSTLASGDDNIALKSGRDEDGRRLAAPCREVVIMGCQAEGRFGFLCCGSEESGGIENVWAYDNWTYGRGVGSVLWVKSNSRRGGYVRNINIDTFRGAHLRGAVVAVTARYGGQSGSFPPALGDLHLRRLTIDGAPRVAELDGEVGPVTIEDSRFTGIGEREVRGVTLRNVEIR